MKSFQGLTGASKFFGGGFSWCGQRERRCFARDQSAHLGPGDDLEASIEVLDQCGATFHPITVVAVSDTVDVFDLGVVNMPTNHAVGAAIFGQPRHRTFVIVDEGHRVLDLVFEVFR